MDSTFDLDRKQREKKAERESQSLAVASVILKMSCGGLPLGEERMEKDDGRPLRGRTALVT